MPRCHIWVTNLLISLLLLDFLLPGSKLLEKQKDLTHSELQPSARLQQQKKCRVTRYYRDEGGRDLDMFSGQSVKQPKCCMFQLKHFRRLLLRHTCSFCFYRHHYYTMTSFTVTSHSQCYITPESKINGKL